MHINVMGQGPDLVMLHGWSMHSAVWHVLADYLAERFTLHLVDLPGHGNSDWHEGALDLDNVINDLANELPEQAYWMGWSLGGLISIAFTQRFPKRVKKLILIASSPCFVQAETWCCAVDAKTFKQFADNLNNDQLKTLQRFIVLQARGSQHSRNTINELTEQLASAKPPVKQALQAGLTLLIETDLRQSLSALNCPIQIILGDLDTLIPVEMLSAAVQLNPNITTNLLAGAGHAPFISHAIECQQIIEKFINEK